MLIFIIIVRQFEDSLRQTYPDITDDQVLELRDKDFNGWIKQQVSSLIYYLTYYVKIYIYCIEY
jgi:hypothetical protein